MTLIMPSGVVSKTADEILGKDDADILRREVQLSAKNPPQDRLTSLEFEVEDGDVIADYEAVFDGNGDRVRAELADWKHNVLASGTNTLASGTITFQDADQLASGTNTAVRARAFVTNSADNRVSERYEGLLLKEDRKTSELTDEEIPHIDADDYVDTGSSYDVNLRNKSDVQVDVDELKELESLGDSIFDDQHNRITDVEQHVDLISGGIDSFSDDPIQKSSDYEDSKDASNGTRLYPNGENNFSAKEPDYLNGTNEVSFNDSGSTIQFYSSPGGSRSSGDQTEKQDLIDEKPLNSGTRTIYDETNEVDVTYSSTAELDTRINEIESIVSDFNSNAPLKNLYTARKCSININTNRIEGFGLSLNLQLNASAAIDVRLNFHIDCLEEIAGLVS